MFFSSRVPPQVRYAYKKDAIAGTLSAMMIGLSGPFVAVIAREKLHASDFEIALLTMSGVAGHLFAIFWAKMLEGRRKMPFAVTAFSIARVPLLLAFLARTHWSFVGLFITANLLASVASPAYSALMKEIYPDSDRARIMGYVRAVNWVALIAATAIATWLLGVVGYRYVFPIAGLAGIAGAIVFGKIPSKDASGDPDVGHFQFFRDSVSILRDDRPYLWFCAGVFMFGFANFIALPVWTIYQVDVLGVGTQWAGIYSITVQLATMVSFFYWGAYVDKSPAEKAIVAQTVITIAVPVVYCLSSKPWMLLPAMLAWGIVCAGSELAYMRGVLHFAPAKRVAQYQALFMVSMGVRGIVGPYIGTALLHSGLLTMKGVFALQGALLVVAVVVQLVGLKRYGAAEQHTKAI
jgi:predicted MFS family arabinose efflux permease